MVLDIQFRNLKCRIFDFPKLQNQAIETVSSVYFLQFLFLVDNKFTSIVYILVFLYFCLFSFLSFSELHFFSLDDEQLLQSCSAFKLIGTSPDLFLLMISQCF